jgi:hypothetical protein
MRVYSKRLHGMFLYLYHGEEKMIGTPEFIHHQRCMALPSSYSRAWLIEFEVLVSSHPTNFESKRQLPGAVGLLMMAAGYQIDRTTLHSVVSMLNEFRVGTAKEKLALSAPDEAMTRPL